MPTRHTNNAGIGDPDGDVSRITYERDFLSYVKYGGYIVSNYCDWDCDFTLVPVNGKWQKQ